MKINNSAELTELIQQAVLMMVSRADGVVLIRTDSTFQDFEKETRQIGENLWSSFEAGTLDISDPYSMMEI